MASKEKIVNYLTYRKFLNYLFHVALVLSSVVVVFPLFLIIKLTVTKGLGALNWEFLTSLPTPPTEVGGGMVNAILGTLYMVTLGSIMAIPVGILGGIYLSEFGNTKSAAIFRLAIDLLSGVPSIVVGIFSYLVIVSTLKIFSALAGGCALAIIILPIVTKSTEEILKLVPQHIREAGLALGLPKWRVTYSIILKGNRKAIVTGVMLAISRASGETAPLLFTATTFPDTSFNLFGPMASLPVEIYTYANSAYANWQNKAWSAALVLITLVFGMNIFARIIIGNANVPYWVKRIFRKSL